MLHLVTSTLFGDLCASSLTTNKNSHAPHGIAILLNTLIFILVSGDSSSVQEPLCSESDEFSEDQSLNDGFFDAISEAESDVNMSHELSDSEHDSSHSPPNQINSICSAPATEIIDLTLESDGESVDPRQEVLSLPPSFECKREARRKKRSDERRQGEERRRAKRLRKSQEREKEREMERLREKELRISQEKAREKEKEARRERRRREREKEREIGSESERENERLMLGEIEREIEREMEERERRRLSSRNSSTNLQSNASQQSEEPPNNHRSETSTVVRRSLAALRRLDEGEQQPRRRVRFEFFDSSSESGSESEPAWDSEPEPGFDLATAESDHEGEPNSSSSSSHLVPSSSSNSSSSSSHSIPASSSSSNGSSRSARASSRSSSAPQMQFTFEEPEFGPSESMNIVLLLLLLIFYLTVLLIRFHLYFIFLFHLSLYFPLFCITPSIVLDSIYHTFRDKREDLVKLNPRLDDLELPHSCPRKEIVANLAKAYCFIRRRPMKVVQSRPEYYLAKCTRADCHFIIRYCWSHGSMVQQEFQPHVCSPLANRVQYTTCIQGMIMQLIQDNPTIRRRELIAKCRALYGITVTNRTMKKAIDKLRERGMFSDDVSISLIEPYLKRFAELNPGTVFKVYRHRNNVFRSVHVCHGVGVRAFRLCHPILFIDCCHFKVKYRGYLMTATVRDGDNKIFPLAFAIVPSENRQEYSAFLDLIAEALNIESPVAVMSDRNRSIITEVSVRSHLFAPHYFCAVHLFRNFNKKGCTRAMGWILTKLFKAESQAKFDFIWTRVFKYRKNWEVSLRQLSLLPHDTIHPEFHKIFDLFDKYATIRLAGSRVRHVTNNIAESNNHWIEPVRDLQSHFEIMKRFLVLIQERFERRHTFFLNRPPTMPLSPDSGRVIARHFIKAAEKCQDPIQVPNMPDSFTVKDHYSLVFTVDYDRDNDRFECDCRYTDHRGIPCIHICKVMRQMQLANNFVNYCSPLCHTDHLRLTYSEAVHLPDEGPLIPDHTVLPRRLPHEQRVNQKRRPSHGEE